MNWVSRSVAGMAATITFVGGWEGLRLEAYSDVVGQETICYGETKGVQMGDTATKAECDTMLASRLEEFENGISACIQPWERLPVKTRISLVSWAYNVGVGGACRSTAVRRFNAGEFRGGCDAVTWWNKGTIKGRRVTIPGLVNRRAAEHALCLADL